jgi:glycosyltransferase involved in cell wall biosynthesis
MRVLIASDLFYPQVSGASYFAQRFAQTLAQKGHEVAVVAPALSYKNSDEDFRGIRFFGLRSLEIPFYRQTRFIIPFTSLFKKDARRILKTFKPDIVHIQSHFTLSRTVAGEAQKLGLPIVATNHFMPENLTYYLHLPAFITHRINSAMWHDAVRVYKCANVVTAPSRTAATMLEPQLKKTVPIISNGIALGRFTSANPTAEVRSKYSLPNKPTLIFVGRLDQEKNIDVVLRAVSLALKKIDFQFVVAGHGHDQPSLHALAKELGIQNNVTFTGFVPDELLPNLYASAQCFVNACTAELQCIALMEAMATGLPAIGANAVALPELIHHNENGYLFTPGKSDELAEYIVKIFSDENRRKQMGQKSLEIIKNHDINVTVEKFEEFYRQAVAAHGA